jgi:hypothetical protein
MKLQTTRSLGSARGFPKSIYCGEVPGDFVCSICNEVLNDPFQCKNGHVNCKECWNDLILKTGPECSFCRTNVRGFDDLSKCLIVNKQVAALLVKCDCLDNINACHSGCEWTGTLAERESRECEFLFAKCPHEGCKHHVRIESLNFHKSQCPKRPKKCHDCNMYFPSEEFREGGHSEVCVSPNHWLGCNCGVMIRSAEIAFHKANECPMTTIQCAIFRDMGLCVETCNGMIKRGACSMHLGPNAALIRALYMRYQDLKKNKVVHEQV